MSEAEEKIEKCEECKREIEPDTEDETAFRESDGLCQRCWERESRYQREHEAHCTSLLYSGRR